MIEIVLFKPFNMTFAHSRFVFAPAKELQAYSRCGYIIGRYGLCFPFNWFKKTYHVDKYRVGRNQDVRTSIESPSR